MGVQIKMHIVHFVISSVYLIVQMCLQSEKSCKNLTKPGLLGDVKTQVRARKAHTAENIVAVRDSVARGPSTSTCRRAQQFNHPLYNSISP
jgi:hypothetical protein